MKFTHILVVLCVAFVFFLSACMSDWTARGYRQYQRGNYDGAIYDFGIALQSSPTNTTALLFRALSFEQIGRPDNALADFKSALETTPSLAHVFVARAELYYRMCDFTNAASDYRHAVDIGFSDGRLYRGYAWLLATCPDRGLRNGHKAVEIAEKAVQYERSVEAYCVLAAALAEVGDYAKAVEMTKTAINIIDRRRHPDMLKRAEWCLKLYEARQPWRQKDEPSEHWGQEH